MLRPWTEVLEDLSLNHLEYKVLQRGHYLRRLLERDKGIDAKMEHYGKGRSIENGEVRFQLKARTELKTTHNGQFVSCRVEVRHLRFWNKQVYPFILVVFHGQKKTGYWLHVQPYVKDRPRLNASERKTVVVHVPVSNKLTVQSIDHFRELSLAIVEEKRQEVFGPRR